MRRAPSGLLACLALATSGLATPARAEPADCLPAVQLEGAPVVITPLVEALAQAGLAAPAPGCLATTVKVLVQPEGLVLDIVDVFGRSTHRAVRTVAGAVALIESRARTEMMPALGPDSPVEEPRREIPAPPEEPPLARVATPAPAPPASRSAHVEAAASPATSRVTVALTPETSLSSDGAMWFGMVLSTGVTVGPTCVGALLRLKSDLDNPGDPAGPRGRRSMDVALSFELPWRSGSFTIRPGLELGAGQMSSDRAGPVPNQFKNSERAPVEGVKPAQPLLDPLDEQQRAGLRTGAQLAIAWRFWGRWHLQAAAGLGLSLFAETGPLQTSGVALPGEPRAIARTSLGLRYGGL